jgi:hypothetical protein
MPMTNYRDLSTSTTDVKAGFQFEFFCELTGETWKSPFVPYRRGQLNAWLSRATTLFHQIYAADRVMGYAAEGGVRKAKAEALEEAQELAARRFRQCEQCRKWVCLAAWDEDAGTCTACARKPAGNASRSGYGGAYTDDNSTGASAGPVCPNCQTPSQGGRFCHECGFDMASSHKTCPSCGTTLPRSARFCTDCGHSF